MSSLWSWLKGLWAWLKELLGLGSAGELVERTAEKAEATVERAQQALQDAGVRLEVEASVDVGQLASDAADVLAHSTARARAFSAATADVYQFATSLTRGSEFEKALSVCKKIAEKIQGELRHRNDEEISIISKYKGMPFRVLVDMDPEDIPYDDEDDEEMERESSIIRIQVECKPKVPFHLRLRWYDEEEERRRKQQEEEEKYFSSDEWAEDDDEDDDDDEDEVEREVRRIPIASNVVIEIEGEEDEGTPWRGEGFWKGMPESLQKKITDYVLFSHKAQGSLGLSLDEGEVDLSFDYDNRARKAGVKPPQLIVDMIDIAMGISDYAQGLVESKMKEMVLKKGDPPEIVRKVVREAAKQVSRKDVSVHKGSLDELVFKVDIDGFPVRFEMDPGKGTFEASMKFNVRGNGYQLLFMSERVFPELRHEDGAYKKIDADVYMETYTDEMKQSAQEVGMSVTQLVDNCYDAVWSRLSPDTQGAILSFVKNYGGSFHVGGNEVEVSGTYWERPLPAVLREVHGTLAQAARALSSLS